MPRSVIESHVPSLNSGVVHLWLVRIGGACLDYDPGPLSPDERSRATRFIFDRDRNRYVACRYVLRSLLASYLGTLPESLLFDYTRYGKPSVRLPDNREDLQFNVSHSDDWALIAITTGHRVGVDIERLRELEDGEGIASRFFSEAEAAEFRRLPEEQRIEAFFNCWTRKEAFIKACGEGLSHPLEDFDVSLAPGQAARLLAIRGNGGSTEAWSLEAWTPLPGYAAAAAVDFKPMRFELVSVIDPSEEAQQPG